MLTKAGFELFANLLSDAALLVSADGTVEDMNRQAERMFGLDASKDAGKSLFDHVDDREELQHFLKSCARSSAGIPGSVKPKDGEYAVTGWGALVRPAKGGRPGTVFLRLSETDVRRRFVLLNEKIDQLAAELDRRRAAEDRLRTNEKALQDQFRLAAFTSETALAISQESDSEKMLERCTRAMVEHLDAAFARVWILEHDQVLCLRASAGQYTNLDGAHSRIELGQFKIGRIAQDQKPHLTNSVVGDPNVQDQEWAQREKMVSFAGYPLVIEQRTLGVIAMFARHELSEGTMTALGSVAGALANALHRKQIENDLHASIEALRRADLRKNEYVAMLAHELRGPLAPIRHLIEQLRRGAEIDQLIPRIDNQLKHIVRLVDDLLDTSRVSQGKIALKYGPVAVSSLIDSSLEAAMPGIDQRGHRLAYEPLSTDIVINCDPFRLRQVVVNLLHNATKYTPDGGFIDVSVQDLGESIEISVRDNGVGIAPEFLPEVFEMFSQSTRSLDRQEGGLGLGLTLARTLAEAHGGSLTASSKGHGHGSTFRLTLPKPISQGYEPEEMVEHQHPLRHSILIDQARILVVDDNRESADTLKDLLELMSCGSVDVGYDGQQGLDLATANDYDVLILDIGLPAIDGYELARAVRKTTRNRDALLIALTGYGSPEERRLTKEAGYDHHLVKPLEIATLESLFT